MGVTSSAATPIVLSTLFPVLAILAVIGRFWSRKIQKDGLKIDDWVALAALVACIGNASIVVVAPTQGRIVENLALDPSHYPIPTADLRRFQACVFANQICGHVSIVLSRAAVLFLYTRIFFVHRSFNILTITLHILNVSWGITFIAVYIQGCLPLSEISKKPIGTRNCDHGPLTPWKACSMISCSLDAIILALPWYYVLRLRLPRKDKLAVLGTFMLGCFVVVASVGKVWNIWKMGEELRKATHVIYYESTLMYWIVPETCLAVVCACLPVMRPLAVKLASKFISLSPGAKSSHSSISATLEKSKPRHSLDFVCRSQADMSIRDVEALSTRWEDRDMEFGFVVNGVREVNV